MSGCFKCQRCKHFDNQKSGKKPNEWHCDAFPEGIPEMKIAFITRDDCVNCNNGIGFEPEE